MTNDKAQWRIGDGTDESQREIETQHRLLIESWAQAVWETDAAGVVTADSPSWRAYTGQTLEEWLGYGWLDAIHPDDRAYAELQWREAIAARGLVNAEFRLRTPDGGWCWTNVRAAPVLDAGGVIERWVGLNIDIDARKRAEAARRDSEACYRTLFEAMDEAYAVVEVLKDQAGAWVDFRFVEVNPAFIEHTSMPWPVGKTATELLGRPNPRWTLLYGQALDTGASIRVEEDEPTLGRIFDLNIFPLDQDRNRVAVLFTDITTRKRAEAALRESEERQAFLLKLSDALRAEPDADAVANRALKILFDHLRLDRCYITYYRPADDEADFPYQLGNDTVPPLPAKVRLSSFPDAYEQVLEKTFVIEDDFERRGLSDAERASSKALGMRAMVASTVRRGEKRPLCSMAAVSSRPRRWSPGEIALVEEAAERTWAAIERARGEAALRESEERFRHVVRATRDIVWDIDLVADRVWWSEALQTELGFTAEEIGPDTAWCFAHMHPEDRERVVAGMRAAAASTSSVWSDEFRYRRADDTYAHIADRGFIIRDAAGRALRMTGAMQDVTTRKRAKAVLRESEERLQLALDTARLATWDWDIARDEVAWSDRHFHMTGYTIGEVPPSYAAWVARVHPEDRAEAEAVLARARTERSDYVHTFRSLRPDQSVIWVSARGRFLYDAEGRATRMIGVAEDITDAHLANEALRESEERFSQFAASSSDALWIRDSATLAMEYTSSAIQAIYGIAPDGILGDVARWVKLIVPEDRETAMAHIEQAKAGAPVTHEFRVQRPADGEVRWIKNTDFPLRDGAGRVQRIGGIAEDVTEAKRAAHRQEVLVNELQHRARNLLGVVAAVADRTVKQGGSVEAFEERLQALSRAQGLLSQGGSDTVEVGALVRAELAAHADGASDRATISGPGVHLQARQVQNFALALHELTTNAVKYGALKVLTGRLVVTWDVVLDRRERRRLALSWVESGVAIDSGAITRRGYGTELIQEALAYALEATVDYELSPDGVRCRIEMPVS